MDWAHGERPGCWSRRFFAVACLLIAGFPERLTSQSAAAPSGAPGSTSAAPLAIPVPGAVRTTDEMGDEAADTPRATLHVYANLMQVPVLVLDSDREPMKPVPESKFRIRVDGGPPFKPTHVRREADDPLELAVLIDVSHRDNELLPGIAAAVAALAPGSLHPWDHVSVYVMDCALIRTALNAPADPIGLWSAIDRGMASWRERLNDKHPPACKSQVYLFDAMAYVTSELKTLPGRRAMLVLTDGVDGGSHNNWNRLMLFEQMTSTAVFGLRSRQEIDDEHLAGFSSRHDSITAGIGYANARSEDRFDIICQSSGGVQFALSDRGLAKGLVRFVNMLRDRYIIEYPRSNTAAAGMHDISVSIADPYAYVRPAGISVPLPDRKLLDDPMTLPSQAEVPIEGPRRILGRDEPAPARATAPPAPQ